MSIDNTERFDAPGIDARPEPSHTVATPVPRSPITAVEAAAKAGVTSELEPVWRPDGPVIRVVGTAAMSSEFPSSAADGHEQPQPESSSDPTSEVADTESATSNDKNSGHEAARDEGAATPPAGGAGTPPIPPTEKPPTGGGDHGDHEGDDDHGDEGADSQPANEPADVERPEGTDAPAAPPTPSEHRTPAEVVEAYREPLQAIARTGERVIEDANNVYGRVRTVGSIQSPGDYNLAVVEEDGTGLEQPEDDVESVRGLAVESIQFCLLDRPDRPPELASEPAEGYTIDDSVVYEPNGGYVGVQKINKIVNGQTADELVTVTTVDIPDDEDEIEALYGRFYSKDGQVVHAEMIAIGSSDRGVYDTCLDIFGDHTLATRLLQRDFPDEEALTRDLNLVRTTTLDMNVYPPEVVDAILAQVREVGLRVHQDRRTDNGLRPDRLERAHRFLRALTA